MSSDHEQNREKYIIAHSTPEDPLLSGLNRETHLKLLNPEMLSGHYQGKLLEMISLMIAPSRILEIGTYSGYSAICLARGLGETGELHTIEKNDEIRDFALKYIRETGLENRIIMHTGDALEIIPSLTGPFDLVFIDGDKSEYIRYYDLAFPKVRKGGIIIADNVLWYNKVYKPEFINDEFTRYMYEFNRKIANDTRVENLLLPVRDGLMIIRKK
ncbi:MAG: O-methyltransferase [Marinilabiliales bacterium]|nr:MAG: O-methyltransferase [Marinilabiliales bacterium]